LLKQTRY
jgi:hypothetical protein